MPITSALLLGSTASGSLRKWGMGLENTGSMWGDDYWQNSKVRNAPAYICHRREGCASLSCAGRDFSTDMARAQSHTVIANHSNCLPRARNGRYMCVQQFQHHWFLGQGEQLTYSNAHAPKHPENACLLNLLPRLTLPSASGADQGCFLRR